MRLAAGISLHCSHCLPKAKTTKVAQSITDRTLHSASSAWLSKVFAESALDGCLTSLDTCRTGSMTAERSRRHGWRRDRAEVYGAGDREGEARCCTIRSEPGWLWELRRAVARIGRRSAATLWTCLFKQRKDRQDAESRLQLEKRETALKENQHLKSVLSFVASSRDQHLRKFCQIWQRQIGAL